MFYVFYSYGSCQDGSHACGLEEWETIEGAREQAEGYRRQALATGYEGEVSIIEGRGVE